MLTVLTQLNLNNQGATRASDVSFADICNEIDARRPVVVVIQYLDAPGEHYLLIVGYAGTDSITIGDPADGKLFTASFDAYLNPGAYVDPSPVRVHGSWSAVYYLDAI
jgi:hypothetical protein